MASTAAKQARVLLQSGKADQARAMLLREAQKSPRDAETLSLLTFALTQSKQWDQAIYYAERVIGLKPGDPGAAINLANVYSMAGRSGDAIGAYERALAMNSDDPRARIGLAGTLYVADRFADAAEQFRRALGEAATLAGPLRDADASMMFAAALWQLGRAGEGVKALRRAAELFPGHPAIAARLAHMLLYDESAEPEAVAAALKEHAAALVRAFPERTRTFDLARDPEKRLRVGIVCADLRSHASMWFLAPLLDHHDRAKMELAVYHTARTDDEVTARHRPAAAVWRHVPELPPAALAQRIVDDRVDVLLDLSGMTQGHRLPVFALRAAPVQATYLAFPATTGLPTMDWRIVDRVTDPEELAGLSTERLARLDPCCVCFRPAPGAPEVSEAPMLRSGSGGGGGGATFGCFAGLYKMNPRVFAVWARLLKEVPGSRLVLKHYGLAQPDARADVAARLSAAGIEEGRVTLEPPAAGAAGVMAAYAGVDVSLDTFPYCGTTTTCESLFMGVPMVTLQGRASAGRVSESIVRAVGLGECVAASEEEYVRIAAGLVRDGGRLAELRRGLRARFAASPVGDERGFAARFEGVLRGMWREWCERSGGGSGASENARA